jgi:hypothetical protein
MTRLTACPSPKGTNIERLFIPLTANTMAHDAVTDPRTKAADRRRGPARDQEPEPDDDLADIVSELQGIFRKGLADEDVVRGDQLLEQLLGFCGGGEGEDEGDPGNNPNRQQDLTSGTRDARRGMDRMPTRRQIEGGGLGLDRAWPARGGDARSEARAEADFQRRFGCGPPPRSM